MRFDQLRWREFLTLLGGAAAWSLYAHAQQPAVPVNGAAADAYPGRAAAFRKGLEESGYVEGQNVAAEYHWLDGRYDRLPTLPPCGRYRHAGQQRRYAGCESCDRDDPDPDTSPPRDRPARERTNP